MLVGTAFCSPREKSMVRKRGKLIATGRLEHLKKRIARYGGNGDADALFGATLVPWEVAEDGRRIETTWAAFRANLEYVVATEIKGPRWYDEKFLPWWNRDVDGEE